MALLLKPIKLLSFLFLLSLGLLSCKKDKPDDPKPTPKFYPVSVTRAASYTTDTMRSVFTYNTANQITKEEIFKNGALESYSLFNYNAAGKLIKKTYHHSSGKLEEHDEISYNAANKPDRLSHGFYDAANVFEPHHYRVHQFNAAGQITEWRDFMPSGQLMNGRTYTYNYATGGQVTSPAFGNNNQPINTSYLVYDGRYTPFQHTAINLITFVGNELSHEVKDLNGQVISVYNNAITYTPAGYPEKITQTHADGTVKTEAYVYRSE